jgi:hypothetical protein
MQGSVEDPEPDPQDPHLFGPPGSGSGSYQSDVWIRILPFFHKGVERTEIKRAKSNFNTKSLQKNLTFKTEDNVLAGCGVT